MMHELEDLIPHRAPMLLLDSVTDTGPGYATARVRISSESSFFVPGKGVPAYVSIEYLAQAIAALAGAEAIEAGTPIPVGYLLGTRKFSCNDAWIPAGSKLMVHVEEDYVDGHGMGAYTGKVMGNGFEAQCRLTVFRSERAA